MKIFLCLIILCASAIYGYNLKRKLKRELNFLEYLKEYANFCLSNISLFKNNLSNIIDNFIIMQKNKNAKYNQLFIKNGDYFKISEDFLSKLILNKNDYGIIYTFLQTVGTNEYDFERQRIENFISYLDVLIAKEKELLKTKADLKFKLVLAIGMVICIVIW